MPNHSHLIKNHSLVRYTRAASGIKTALAKLDADLRRLERDRSLFDGERAQRKEDARRTALTTIRKHRAEMSEALADHRSWSTAHTDDAPSGEEAQRRSYYSTRAQAELANLGEADALALVQRMAATGDTERGQEYVAAARGRVPAGALRALERQVESADASGARHWGAAVNAIEQQLAMLDHHVTTLMDQAGHISDAARAGTAPEEPLSLRRLDLWTQGLDGHASNAFQASVAADGEWTDVAMSLATAGTAGWDASDEQRDAPAPGGAQALAGTPADATADRSDAQDDAGVQA